MNKLYFPNNIFSCILSDHLEANEKNSIIYLPSASLTKKLIEDFAAVALIPVSDILTNKELFVSDKIGISFDGSPCNSYIYYDKDKSSIDKISLFGDASTIEVIFGKILFKETYDVDVEINLTLDKTKLENTNNIVVGDYNFIESKYVSGFSFAEEVAEMISAPFVNYILASQDKDSLLKISERLSAKISEADFDDVNLPAGFSSDTTEFIKKYISKAFYSLNEEHIEGINQLMRLPFYHGMVKDIVEVKFV